VAVAERPEASVTDTDGLRWRARSAGSGAAYLDADAPPSAALALRLAQRRAALWSSRPRSTYDLLPAYGGLLAEFRAGADAGEVLRWLTTPRAATRSGARSDESDDSAQRHAAALAATRATTRPPFRVPAITS